MEKYDVLESILLNKFVLTVFVLMIMLALSTIPGMPTTSMAPPAQPF